MFTGIIHQYCTVIDIEKKNNFSRLTIDLGHDLIKDIQIGASVAINGVCLTVTQFFDTKACFDVMGETLRLTTLGGLQIGDQVNVERAARQGDEIGGHQLSGHIDGVAAIVAVTQPDDHDDNYVIEFLVTDKKLRPYLFNKGYIGLDGASLTIVDWDMDQGLFAVHLIPETINRTILGQKQVGDHVNLEIDRATQAIVDTVTRVLKTMNVEFKGK